MKTPSWWPTQAASQTAPTEEEGSVSIASPRSMLSGLTSSTDVMVSEL